MAHLNYKDAFKDLQQQVFKGIESHFPVDGRLQTLELEGLEVDDSGMESDDIRSQKAAKMDGTTWSAPVFATMALKDNTTGKVKQRRKLKVADIPLVTRRHSHIVEGQEYQIGNQWQLKPGAYTKRRQSGELETAFNVPNKQSFDITFNPEKKLFRMERGKSKAIPVYPLMKAMGVSDEELEKRWGKDVLEANKSARGNAGAMAKFFKADRKKAPKTPEEAENYFIDTMTQSQLRPDATEVTLGKKFDSIDGEVLSRATTKMIGVQQGKIEEDDRDSLVFKDLRGPGEFAYDKLTNWKTARAIRNKALRQINQAKTIRNVIKFDTFNEPIRQTFSKDDLAEPAAQINPVEMVANSMKTTIMGPGGIQSEQAITPEQKLINPSHLGYLDPIHTPEGEKTGVTLHLPMAVKKVGKEARIPVFNVKTGKMEHVGPGKFLGSNVVMPDQVSWDKKGKPTPVGSSVKMAAGNNEIEKGKFKDADYVMMHPSQMFSVTSNLIPFLGNNSGNRASYADSHIEQAISLQKREAPLVQTSTGTKKAGLQTFEEFLGKNTGHTTPVDGEVTKVGKDAIHIKGKDGKEREVQIYDNFPLNDTKSVLHSEATVKPGDKVKAGQSVADTNFTKGGKLALGTNLNVAYVPYRGYNFEDGVVISESAASKLSSVHMHKPSQKVDKETVTDPKKFMIQHTEAFTKDQYKTLGKDGVVAVGTKVQTGDPLIIGTKPYELKDKTGVRAIRKSASGAHTDVSTRWESDHPGEVVGVHKNKKGEVTVHVRTV
jgi:DNA-directed RNA polymerase subunit beta